MHNNPPRDSRRWIRGSLLGLWLLVAGVAYERTMPTHTQSASDAGFRVAINEADTSQLMLLPGIGRHLARRVVGYREAYGPFQTLSDLTKVPGIGPKTLRRIKPYIQVKPLGGTNAPTMH